MLAVLSEIEFGSIVQRPEGSCKAFSRVVSSLSLSLLNNQIHNVSGTYSLSVSSIIAYSVYHQPPTHHRNALNALNSSIPRCPPGLPGYQALDVSIVHLSQNSCRGPLFWRNLETPCTHSMLSMPHLRFPYPPCHNFDLHGLHAASSIPIPSHCCHPSLVGPTPVQSLSRHPLLRNRLTKVSW